MVCIYNLGRCTVLACSTLDFLVCIYVEYLFPSILGWDNEKLQLRYC